MAGGRMRMLLSSAGRRVALLRAFRAAAASLDLQLEILACDLEPAWSAACRLADRAVAVPRVTDPAYVDAVLALCAGQGISLIVPTIDTELLAYARAAERFAAIGTTIAVGSPAIVGMARDKLATARFLARAGVPSPRTATPAEILAEPGAWPWPLIAKPRAGSSSRGIVTLEDGDALARLVETEPYVVQELLVGREYTVNLFFDRDGALRCAVPHERRQVRAGEVEKGTTVRDATLCGLARRIAAALDRPFGAMCFQAIRTDDGRAAVFEINARFGGGYPLADRAGAPFARWLLEAHLGLASSASDDWQDGVSMIRYDDAVFA